MRSSRPAGSLISYMSDKVKAGGGINLAQGIPGFAPPPELLDALRRLVDEPVHQYAPGQGDAGLLDAVGVLFAPHGPERDQLLITNGATEAIALIYAYLAAKLPHGFATLAFEPVYESYRNLPPLFGSRFVPFDAPEGILPRLPDLWGRICDEKVRVVFVCSPGNPWGRIWRRDEVERLIALSEELDFFVIFDAVYHGTYFGEAPYLPVERISPRLFFVDSFSKMLSITGWRVGFLAADRSHFTALKSMHDYTGLSSPSLLQKAIARYLADHEGGRDYVAVMRELARCSFEALRGTLSGLGFRVPPTDGGYFVWAGLPPGFDDGLAFAEDLYEKEKVAVVPGVHFSDAGERFVRFNIARPLEEIKEAARRIEKFVRTGRRSKG